MQYTKDIIFIFGYAALSFLIAFVLAPWVIKLLHKYKMGKQIREVATDGAKATIFNELHQKKAGTPTMGGIVIWGSVIIVIIISRILAFWGIGYSFAGDNEVHSLLQRSETWLPLFTLVVTAILGLVDDWFNIRGKGKSKGINVRPKFFWLMFFALLGAWWFYFKLGCLDARIDPAGMGCFLHMPGVGDFNIGWWYIAFFVFLMLATSNAVNITDGLDGLAGGLLIMSFSAFGVIAYAKEMPYLAAFCAVIAGSLAAFLWYNVAPAKFYMGDTGAISLGATLAIVSILTNSVFILPIVGLVYVIEILSVIIQLTSKRFLKRKVFKVAPLHHHFEALGWPETNVVMRFWIIGGVMSVLGIILGLVGMGLA